MVRHNVYFWLDPTLTDEQKASFEDGLRALFRIDVVAAGSFGKARQRIPTVASVW